MSRYVDNSKIYARRVKQESAKRIACVVWTVHHCDYEALNLAVLSHDCMVTRHHRGMVSDSRICRLFCTHSQRGLACQVLQCEPTLSARRHVRCPCLKKRIGFEWGVSTKIRHVAIYV